MNPVGNALKSKLKGIKIEIHGEDGVQHHSLGDTGSHDKMPSHNPGDVAGVGKVKDEEQRKMQDLAPEGDDKGEGDELSMLKQILGNEEHEDQNPGGRKLSLRERAKGKMKERAATLSADKKSSY